MFIVNVLFYFVIIWQIVAKVVMVLISQLSQKECCNLVNKTEVNVYNLNAFQ